jgi:flagellar assembly factor FliW
MKALQSISLLHTRFGTIEYTDEDVFTFPEGIIGFPEERRFLLITTSERSTFRWLQSLDTPGLAFLVTDPGVFVSDYEPSVEARREGLLALATVSIPPGKAHEMTLNLAGPITIDPATRNGHQIVLDSEAYTTKHRVFAKASCVVEDSAA